MQSGEFEQLYEDHAQALFGFLAYRTGDRTVAEDLVAETFERVLRSWRRFDPRQANRKTWLYAIGLNLLRDHLRRTAVEGRVVKQSAVLQGPASNPGTVQVEARDLVTRGMEVLSGEEREAIALRYGGDLTVPEIARVTGESLTTVEGRVYRALRKLREEIGEEIGVD